MTCQHCTADLPPFALFCGECGRSVSAPVAAQLPLENPMMSATEPTVLCAVCAARGVMSDRFCAECGSALSTDTQIIDRIAPVAETSPEPAPMPMASSLPSPTIDVDSTRIVARGTGGVRFVLQFSTGESYTVLGSGLAGRNPHPEPGEYVDHLVTIVDPGRSVSKTHFEFGQHEGVFWFSDRHSGNGSTIREPGSETHVCEPGRRYPIARGTRVDIGEQFVIVS